METLWQDVKYGVRMLARAPGFTAVAVLTLALGIGTSATMFSVVDGTFLRPLPVKDPGRMMQVFSATVQETKDLLSYAEYLDVREQNTSLSGLAAYARHQAFLTAEDELKWIAIDVVSDNYFTVLGVKPIFGQAFLRRWDHSAERDPVVVLSYALWQQRFGADPALVGKTIQLSGRNYTVIGIAPQRFRGLERFVPTYAWLPVDSWFEPEVLQRRELRHLECVGRLRDKASMARARTELETISHRLAEAYPDTNKNRRFVAISDAERVRRALRPSLLLLAAVGVVLLIACTNVAGLLLAQAERRRREVAIRSALGAAPKRLVRQLLTEGAVLLLLGAGLGLLCTYWLIGLEPAVMPPAAVQLGPDLRIDVRVAGFTLIVSFLSLVIFALVPALQASRTQLVPALKGEEARLQRGMLRPSLRTVLVVAQIALAVPLLTGAGLVTKSLLLSQRIDPGFDAQKKMLLLTIAPRFERFSLEAQGRLYESLTERIKALPAVKRVSYGRRALLSGSGGGAKQTVSMPGVGLPLDSWSIKFNAVGPKYFETVGTPILRGRGFDRGDGIAAPPVVVVNEAMARRFWPNQNPVGKQVEIGGAEHQIIGVAKDAKVNDLHEPPQPYLYLAFAQTPSSEGTLFVETTGAAPDSVDSVKREIRAAGWNILVLNIMTLEQLMRYALWQERTAAGLASSLGLVGIFLAVVGLYGTLSYLAHRRTREIGVRMALGAQRSNVLKLVLGHGIRLCAVGILIGLGLALAGTRVLAGALYGVEPTDPVVFAAGSGLVIAAALLAIYVPARQASKVEPMTALRYE